MIDFWPKTFDFRTHWFKSGFSINYRFTYLIDVTEKPNRPKTFEIAGRDAMVLAVIAILLQNFHWFIEILSISC